ncbi:ABC transporter ATP-binding protein [Candidatus Pacearchaeota archaeon]|nr:ABC transporter ATP-binding protein [Candidatus Pacearchaeota archaeon]
MATIRLQEVRKRYGMGDAEVLALRDVSLNIKQGDFVAILGPSGSGKSTLMNIVGCLDVPTDGSVFLDDVDIGSLHESDLAKVRGKKVGFVFQSFNLIPTLTALENVMLPMTFQGAPREEREKRATELLKSIGLGERLSHLPSQLSGGEQQRVAIARALVNDPEIILADEPTGNLDSARGREVLNTLQQLNKQGKTIIIVTHDTELAKFARKIVRIKDGSITEIKKSEGF